MSFTLSSLFCCATARKPAQNQTRPPEYGASETDLLLDRGSGRGNTSAQSHDGAGESGFQKWEAQQYQKWKKAKPNQDFNSWLADRYRPDLDAEAWEEHQARIAAQKARDSYYTNKPRPGRRLNQLG